jgi:hypothetical protein
MVACVEAHRRGHDTLARELLVRTTDGGVWAWLHLAAGFLGRVPWGGYPFPD